VEAVAVPYDEDEEEEDRPRRGKKGRGGPPSDRKRNLILIAACVGGVWVLAFPFCLMWAYGMSRAAAVFGSGKGGISIQDKKIEFKDNPFQDAFKNFKFGEIPHLDLPRAAEFRAITPGLTTRQPRQPAATSLPILPGFSPPARPGRR
jgi:hypothetical protein